MTRLASHAKRVRDRRTTLVVIPEALLVSGLVLFLLIASTADVSSQAVSCRTSPDGSHVACGGEAVSCRTSPDGSHVACGGGHSDLQERTLELRIAQRIDPTHALVDSVAFVQA